MDADPDTHTDMPPGDSLMAAGQGAGPLLLRRRDPRGARQSVFVAVEGIDAAGKTTLTQTLATTLRSRGVLVAVHREPSHGPVGRLFRELSTHRDVPAMTMALLSTADRDQQQPSLREARRACDVVLADRYYLSGLAYHAVDGVDPRHYQHLNSHVEKPDAYLFLDVPRDLAAQRRDRGPDGHWEQPEITALLPAAYAAGLDLVTDTEGAWVMHLDASAPPRRVAAAALAALATLVPHRREGTDS